MNDKKTIEFAVIQSGYCVWGVGATEQEAYEDAASCLEPDEHGDWDAGRVEAECVARPNDGDLTLMERDRDQATFDSYLKNQGGFEFRNGGWFVA